MAEIKLYDGTELVEDPFWGDFYEQEIYIGVGSLSANVVCGLIDAAPDGEQITVRINSCGGMVFDGWAIYNGLIAAKTRGCRILVRIEGIAASIASIIAMAGDEIIICQAALLMVHKPSVCFWIDGATADDLMKEANALNQIQAVLNQIYVARTGLAAAIIDGMINKETWITPTEAVTMRFADSIEATIVPIEMTRENFARSFRNATPRVREYANSIIKIHKKMDTKEVVKTSKDEAKKNSSLLSQIKNLFKNELAEDEAIVNGTVELAAGGTLYFEGAEIAVNTEVFTDEAMSIHPAEGDHDIADAKTISVDADGIVTEIKDTVVAEAVTDSEELTNLRNEVAELRTQLGEANNSLKENTAILNKLKNIKSNYTPPKREQELSTRGAVPVKATIDREEQKERKATYRTNKNKK